MRLIVADDRQDVPKSRLRQRVLGLEHVKCSHGAGLEVGFRKAQGFLGRRNLLKRKLAESSIGDRILIDVYNVCANLGTHFRNNHPLRKNTPFLEFR